MKLTGELKELVYWVYAVGAFLVVMLAIGCWFIYKFWNGGKKDDENK